MAETLEQIAERIAQDWRQDWHWEDSGVMTVSHQSLEKLVLAALRAQRAAGEASGAACSDCKQPLSPRFVCCNHGCVSYWAHGLEAGRADGRAKLEALVKQWEDSAAWEEQSNSQYAQGLDQCATDLQKLLTALPSAPGAEGQP